MNGVDRERELSMLCSQDALFMITRTALRPGTKMVRGKFVDDMMNGRAKGRFVAAEVCKRREVRRTCWNAGLEGLDDDCQLRHSA